MSPDLPPVNTVIAERLPQAISLLQPRERAVIIAWFFDGLSEEEIAGGLGATPAAVRSLLTSAVRRLRESLLASPGPIRPHGVTERRRQDTRELG